MWQVPNHYGSEPVFVPRPDGASEDDGVILSAVWDGDKGENYLLVLDGKTMAVAATVHCDACDSRHLMSFGIHGRWFNF